MRSNQPPVPGHHRSGLAGAAVVGCALVVAACGSGSSAGTSPGSSAAGTSSGTSSAAADVASGPARATKKTIVFSPLALNIPALKGLSEGLKQYGGGKGYEILIQDPKYDPNSQVQQLQSVVDSGRVGGAWVIPVKTGALSDLVRTARGKGVALLLDGPPAEFGVTGPQPGVSFSVIDYQAEGTAVGKSLGECITAKQGGTADVIFAQAGPGTGGKQEVEQAAVDALKAAAPGATVVTQLVATDRSAAQTAIGTALQAHPKAAVMSSNDEGALGALGAFAAQGRTGACITDAGGNDEVLAAVKSGKIYASAALQFEADMVQSFDQLTKMMNDLSTPGVQLTVPMKVFTAGS